MRLRAATKVALAMWATTMWLVPGADVAGAADWYVRPSGGSNTRCNGRSPAAHASGRNCAFADVTKILDRASGAVAKNGDTVYFVAGTYDWVDTGFFASDLNGIAMRVLPQNGKTEAIVNVLDGSIHDRCFWQIGHSGDGWSIVGLTVRSESPGIAPICILNTGGWCADHPQISCGDANPCPTHGHRTEECRHSGRYVYLDSVKVVASPAAGWVNALTLQDTVGALVARSEFGREPKCEGTCGGGEACRYWPGGKPMCGEGLDKGTPGTSQTALDHCERDADCRKHCSNDVDGTACEADADCGPLHCSGREDLACATDDDCVAVEAGTCITYTCVTSACDNRPCDFVCGGSAIASDGGALNGFDGNTIGHYRNPGLFSNQERLGFTRNLCRQENNHGCVLGTDVEGALLENNVDTVDLDPACTVDVATPNGDFADFYCANDVTIDHNTMVCHSTHGKCVQSQFLYQFPWGAPSCTSNGGPDLGNARFENWRVYGNIAYDLLTDRSVGWEIQGLHSSRGEPSNDPHETLLQSDYNSFYGLRPGHGIGTNRWGVCGGSGFDGIPGTMCLSEFPEQLGGQCHFDGVDGHELTCLFDGLGRTEVGYDPMAFFGAVDWDGDGVVNDAHSDRYSRRPPDFVRYTATDEDLHLATDMSYAADATFACPVTDKDGAFRGSFDNASCTIGAYQFAGGSRASPWPPPEQACSPLYCSFYATRNAAFPQYPAICPDACRWQRGRNVPTGAHPTSWPAASRGLGRRAGPPSR